VNAMDRKQMLEANAARMRELATDIERRELLDLTIPTRRVPDRTMHYSTQEPQHTEGNTMQMNAETENAWNAWLWGNLDQLSRTFGEEAGALERRLMEKIERLESEIGQLKADRQVERAATVVDLPDWRRKDVG
jgi:hypothetical protein